MSRVILLKNIEPILILSKNSFISCNLQHYFNNQSIQYFALSHNNVKDFDFKQYRCVINCVSRAFIGDSKDQAFDVNFSYPKSIIQQCHNLKYIVNMSSFFEFGEAGIGPPINFYSQAKKELRVWLQEYSKYRNISLTNLVLHDVVGRKDGRKKLMNLLIRANTGQEIELSPCRQKVFFLPVENVVRATAVCLKNNRFGTYTPVKVSTFELRAYVEMIRREVNFDAGYGKLEYMQNQIFEPITSLPAVLKRDEALELNKSYITSMISAYK